MENKTDQEFDRKIMELDIMSNDLVSENEKELAWKDILNEIEPKTNRRPMIYWLSAAAVVLLFTVGYLLNQSKSNSYKTSVNEILAVNLKDGSQVSINGNSQLTLDEDFGEEERKVSLVGEAFFNINRDEAKPFVISTKNGAVTVLGTSFNVIALNGKTVVSVRSGLVKLESESGEVHLSQNEKAWIQEDGRITKLNWNQNDYSWYTGVLEFKGESLVEISDKLNGLFKKKVKVASAIENCTISAKIEFETIEDVLDIITETLELSWRMDGDTIIIDGDAC
ncbi:MAG: FecR family protein [bacterium]|nr:FecR family protein [bacterium]